MPSEVTQPLSSLFADFAATRRPDAKGPDADNAQSFGEVAAKSNFGQLVSREALAARTTEQAHKRSPARHLGRPVPEKAAEANRAACDDLPPPRGEEDRVACDGPNAPAEKDRPACRSEDGGGRPAETLIGDEDRKTPTETVACLGPAHSGEGEKTAETVAGDPAAAVPVLTDDATPEGLTPEQASVVAGETLADATTVLGQIATQPVPATPASMATGASGPTAVGEATADGVEGAAIVAGIAVQGEAKAKTDAVLAQASRDVEGDEGEEGADAPSLTPRLITTEFGAEAKKAAGEPIKAPITGENPGIGASEAGERAEVVTNKSTTPNLHPTRSAQFADLVAGFGGSHAIHRPADILAGLDRSVVASAMNRSADVSRPTPLQMLPIEIGMQAVRGVTNFQIRLDPAELGRVDVKLQIRDNGEVNASLIVDRVETLQMLRRDASTLQSAFEQAGLKQSPDGLTFSLRGEGQEGQSQERGRDARPSDLGEEAALQAQIGEAALRRVLIPNSSIDRMV